ncbi:hypothetical protein PsorP6_005901 [Peronosclerospora sorghi]|uniref:Uncharacterized protein n=1 Tax=Peronosclerospora sorghi TaxID=230839 RepID=A0ACC0W5C4_9STRA|nr:hypothetical protein PsorP6_005901 [Peronosclerospora sorghi]
MDLDADAILSHIVHIHLLPLANTARLNTKHRQVLVVSKITQTLSLVNPRVPHNDVTRLKHVRRATFDTGFFFNRHNLLLAVRAFHVHHNGRSSVGIDIVSLLSNSQRVSFLDLLLSCYLVVMRAKPWLGNLSTAPKTGKTRGIPPRIGLLPSKIAFLDKNSKLRVGSFAA